MSDDESLFARWSRRKRAATRPPPDQPKPDAAAAPEAPAATAAPDPAAATADAALPPLESIGAGSDIRAFLAPGVPADLARAALRRAWSADPAIRDFVGLSENAWDFTAPGGVPGFGSLTEEEARRLLGRLAGEPEAGTAEPTAGLPPSSSQPLVAAADSGPAASPSEQDRDAASADAKQGAQNEAVSQSNVAAPRRTHGSALPKTGPS
jgi:hypothetical protein